MNGNLIEAVPIVQAVAFREFRNGLNSLNVWNGWNNKNVGKWRDKLS
jgi:hypothetical protein